LNHDYAEDEEDDYKVLQQGRNNAPVLAIKTINAKLRQSLDRLGLKPQAILCRP